MQNDRKQQHMTKSLPPKADIRASTCLPSPAGLLSKWLA